MMFDMISKKFVKKLAVALVLYAVAVVLIAVGVHVSASASSTVVDRPPDTQVKPA